MYGYHVNRNGRTIATAVSEEIDHISGYTSQVAVQIYTHGPHKLKALLSQNDKDQLRAIFQKPNRYAVIHGAYPDIPWNTMNIASIRNIADELHTAAEIGASGAIIHLGSKENLVEVMDSIGREFAAQKKDDQETDVILWLETNAARASASTYETWDKIKSLFNEIHKLDLPFKCGLCVDTAHLWACGVDLTTRAAAEAWFGALDELGAPIMLHLNDSTKIRGRGADQHAPLCANIWKDYHPDNGSKPFKDSGLAAILEWAANNKVCVILERGENGAISDLNLLASAGYI